HLEPATIIRSTARAVVDADQGRVVASVPIGAGPDAAAFDADRQPAFSSEWGRNPDRGPPGGAGQVRSGRERRPPAERPRMLPGSFTLLVVGRRPHVSMTRVVRPSVIAGALCSILLALALGTGTHASSDPRAAGRMARFS